MINIRTPQEIEKLKKSGEILAEVKQIVYDSIQPGISTQEIDDIAFNEIAKRNAKPAFKGYGGFPGTACISVNAEMIHGIPSKNKIIKDGDVVKVDMGAIWKGYYSDSAFSKGVGKVTASDEKVMAVAKNAFYAGIDQIKPGARVGDIEHAIGKYVRSQGMFVPDGFTGHGVGTNLHEDPQVHNKGSAKTGPLLKDGMIIAIEPMILQTSDEVIHHQDGWTILSKDGKNTAHYEHTVAIVDGKPVILTGDM